MFKFLKQLINTEHHTDKPIEITCPNCNGKGQEDCDGRDENLECTYNDCGTPYCPKTCYKCNGSGKIYE